MLRKPFYDIAIVGGGVMGMSIAYHLSESLPKSASICILERDYQYRKSSTTLSAGGVRQQFSEKCNIEMGLYGSNFIQNAHRLLKVDENVDVQFTPGGYLFLASEAGKCTLRENHALQRQLNAKVDLFNKDQVRALFPWMKVDDIALGSLGGKDEGWFDPWMLLNAFGKYNRHQGVELTKGNVLSMNRSKETSSVDGIWYVDEKNEEQFMQTGMVVNAAGAWSNTLLNVHPKYQLPVERRKRSVFVFHCADRQTWEGQHASPLVIDPSGVYFRREGKAGHFICGVSPKEDEDGPSFEDSDIDVPQHELFENVVWPTIADRVPAFESIKLTSAWSGFYDYNTLDQNGIIGKHPILSNMYMATGFSGHGLQQGPAVGRGIMELIQYGQYKTIDMSCFSFDRILRNKPLLEQCIV